MVAAGATITPFGGGHAYELNSDRWDHSCFTHDGTSEVIAALAAWGSVSDVSDCGFSVHPDISVEVGAVATGTEIGVALRYPRPGTNTVDHCVIRVLPEYRSERPVILHEMGHCLGLGHSSDPWAVMYPVMTGCGFRPDDIAAIQQIYGPRVRPLRFRSFAPQIGG